MPIGKPLGYLPDDIDLDWVRAKFAEHGTKCEAPPFMGACDAPANEVYLSKFSVVFFCTNCYNKAQRMGSFIVRPLAEHLYGMLLKWSYVHQNNMSGGKLDEMVEEYQSSVRRSAREAATELANEMRAQRAAMKEAAVKIGMADDELLSARKLNKVRVAKGETPIGRPQKPRTSIMPVPSGTLVLDTSFMGRDF